MIPRGAEPVKPDGAPTALWGETAEPRQRVYIDLWESYLKPVEG